MNSASAKSLNPPVCGSAEHGVLIPMTCVAEVLLTCTFAASAVVIMCADTSFVAAVCFNTMVGASVVMLPWTTYPSTIEITAMLMKGSDAIDGE